MVGEPIRLDGKTNLLGKPNIRLQPREIHLFRSPCYLFGLLVCWQILMLQMQIQILMTRSIHLFRSPCCIFAQLDCWQINIAKVPWNHNFDLSNWSWSMSGSGSGSGSYLIFIIFFTPPHYLACELYARKVRTFATKSALQQNSVNQYWAYLLFWLAYLVYSALGRCICYMRWSIQSLGWCIWY